MPWAGFFLIICLVLLIVAIIKAMKANPMYLEISRHSKRIEELKSSGQEYLIMQENEEFNKRMMSLAMSDHGSQSPGGFF